MSVYFLDSILSIVKVLPPISMFGNSEGINRSEKKKRVLQRFIDFFNRFWGL